MVCSTRVLRILRLILSQTMKRSEQFYCPQYSNWFEALSGRTSPVQVMSIIIIVKVIESHYEPKHSEIVQRYKFITRAATLEKLLLLMWLLWGRLIVQDCNYGTTLPEMLQDCLVCGINHQRIKCKLLAEKRLDFEKAYAMAQLIEATERDLKDLQSSNPQPVNLVSRWHCKVRHNLLLQFWWTSFSHSM